ncbi:MAG: DEAD/DEAH box helicase [Candidatus Kapabacteria bacterium]|nr:DEAD/DEAH box helicase [Candidatus Kapabacteria bacterium]
MTFADLGLHDRLLRAITDEGYTVPTPIQQEAIPLLLKGHDLFGCAQTGTGKTAAFALPILDGITRSEQRRGPRALILAPTRELAVQIAESFSAYGKYVRFRHVTVFGGVSHRPQADAIRRGVDVVVATPGRLIDLLDQRLLHLDRVETLVLDEADRMLDMGFIAPIRQIVGLLPSKRQTLLFSATIPDEIRELAASLLHEPKHVTVTPVSSAVETVDHQVYYVGRTHKKDLLHHLLANELHGSVLIFSRTKRGADRIVKDLAKVSIRAEALHGDKSQEARQRALGNFKTRRTRILVATDIAARGIDIDELSYVINFDMPDTPETYVHRIGRTGRAGATGVAITLVSPDERNDMRGIERVTRIRANVIADHPYGVSEDEWRSVEPAPRPQQRQQRPSSSGPKPPRRPRPSGGPQHDRRSNDASSASTQERPQRTSTQARPYARAEEPRRDSGDATGGSSRRQPRRPFRRSR